MFHHSSSSDFHSTARFGPGRFFVILIILALLILFLGRTDSPTLGTLRVRMAEAFSGLFSVFTAPVGATMSLVDGMGDLFLVYQDNERLRTENAELLQWKAKAERLETQKARLDALLNVQIDPDIDFVTARAVSDSGSPFVRTVVVNAGRSDGVRKGQAVINQQGLVGRVVGTGEHSARILLLNDLNSRVPVKIGPAGQRAILTGDNGTRPRLEFLMAREVVEEGEAVMTSGDGGVLPPGLPIGAFAGQDGFGHYRVRWHAEEQAIDYVRILQYAFPTEVEVIDEDLPVGPLPGREYSERPVAVPFGTTTAPEGTPAQPVAQPPSASASASTPDAAELEAGQPQAPSTQETAAPEIETTPPASTAPASTTAPASERVLEPYPYEDGATPEPTPLPAPEPAQTSTDEAASAGTETEATTGTGTADLVSDAGRPISLAPLGSSILGSGALGSALTRPEGLSGVQGSGADEESGEADGAPSTEDPIPLNPAP